MSSIGMTHLKTHGNQPTVSTSTWQQFSPYLRSLDITSLDIPGHLSREQETKNQKIRSCGCGDVGLEVFLLFASSLPLKISQQPYSTVLKTRKVYGDASLPVFFEVHPWKLTWNPKMPWVWFSFSTDICRLSISNSCAPAALNENFAVLKEASITTKWTAI